MIKRKFAILICIIFFSGFFLVKTGVYAEKNNKKLELKQNHSHLLSFNEKIIKYRLGDGDAFDVEVLPDIFNCRHEMLVKPLREVNTNLIIWTGSGVYNFDLEAKNRRGLTKFFNFIKDKEPVPEGIESVPGEYEIDMPPFLNKQQALEDLEIDLPPEIR